MKGMNLFAVILLALAASARAEGNIKWGDVNVMPHASLEEKYDDNIFLQSSGKRDSQIVFLNLGTGFSMAGARSKLAISYDLGLLHYDRFSNVNDAVHQTAVGEASYALSSGGKLGFSNKFLATTDPASSELTSRAKRNQNDTIGSAEFPVGAKSYVGLAAQNTIHAYYQDPLRGELNRNEFSVGPRLGYNVSPNTKTYIDYKFKTITYDQSGDKNNTNHMVMLGAEGQLTGRLTGNVEVGGASRNYKSSVTGQTDSETTPALAAGVKWAAPRQVDVTFSAYRRYEESTFNRFYRSNMLGVTVGKALGSRWNAGVTASYGVDDYPDDVLDGATAQFGKRTDHITQAGLNLVYRFPEIFRLNMGYLFRNRDSNFSDFNYSDNVVTLGLGMEF